MTTEELNKSASQASQTNVANPLTRVAVATKLIHAASGCVLASHLEVARGPIERMRGLLGRNGLHPGEGMLIERCSSIHTFCMKFAIDVIFVDCTWVVRKVASAVRPWRMARASGSGHVIELPAGTTKDVPVAPGDVLRIEDIA